MDINYGMANVTGGLWDKLVSRWQSLQDDRQPGFGSTQYRYNADDGKFYRDTMEYILTNNGGGWVRTGSTPLSWPADGNTSGNAYEMLAFCASSIVAPLGTTDWHNIPDVFSGGQNLRDLVETGAFNALNTGHSAQFIGSYVGSGAYWRKLMEDVQ